jgi:uridine kinase
VLIAIEGVDGAGKRTLTDGLRATFQAAGKSVTTLAFPRYGRSVTADVEFRTNEEPPFLNKAVINHALPMLVDGEAAMQWIADRFNGLPTTPNCGQF